MIRCDRCGGIGMHKPWCLLAAPDRPEPVDTDRQTAERIAAIGDTLWRAEAIAAALADARKQGYRAGKAEGEALRTALEALADDLDMSPGARPSSIADVLRAVLDQHGGQR